MNQKTMLSVIKRTGETVKFDPKKIYRAISAANKDTKRHNRNAKAMTKNDLNEVSLKIVSELQKEDRSFNVEEIQDIAESNLMEAGFYTVAKDYILYRQRHADQRNAAEKLMNDYKDLLFADASDMDLKRDNANINTDAPMGIMLKLGAEGAKTFADHYVIDPEVNKADKAGYLHLHKQYCGFAA